MRQKPKVFTELHSLLLYKPYENIKQLGNISGLAPVEPPLWSLR